jgi:hypothetical protein
MIPDPVLLPPISPTSLNAFTGWKTTERAGYRMMVKVARGWVWLLPLKLPGRMEVNYLCKVK